MKRTSSTTQFFKSARWSWHIATQANRWVLLGIIVTTLLGGILPAGLAVVGRNLINSLVQSTRANGGDFNEVMLWIILTFILTILQAGTTAFYNDLLFRLSQYVSYRINYDTLAHAAHLDLEHFEDKRFQDLFARANQNIGDHVASFIKNMLTIGMGIFEAIAIIIVLIAIDPIAVLVVIPLVIPNTWIYWRFAKLRYQRRYLRITKNRWMSYFKSNLTTRDNLPEVKIYNLSPLLLDRYQKFADEFMQEDTNLQRSRTWIDLGFEIVFAIIYSAIFWYQGVRVFEGRLTLGDLVVYGRAVLQLQKSTKTIGLGISTLFEETLYVNDLIEFFETESQIGGQGQALAEPARGAIELRQVSFAYPNTERLILKNLTLNIQAGETIAIVGENGAGKTTLIHLLLRLYNLTDGQILFDGVDIAQVDPALYHRKIAYVPQRFNLYEASVAENIAYGDWETLLDNPDKVRAIAQQTKVDAIIEAMPEKYDTLLGRRFGDYDLSGGQWQRIAITRAFARQAELVILDEPTSNLDARAEFEIFQQFSQLTKGRTTILISHRFSTVSMADRIIVMDKGQIVEQGTHDALMANNGLYAELYRLQQKYQVSS